MNGVQRNAPAFGFLAFPMGILAVFILIPTVAGLGLSLFSWDGSGLPVYIGLTNFRAMFADDELGPAVVNTLVFVICSIPPATLIAFALAVAVHARWFRGKALVRTLFFMPMIVSIVAIGVVWRWVLDDQAGLLNGLLRAVGVDNPPNWMAEDSWPLFWIIVVAIWRQIGFCLVLYLAALSTVNESLYEAAEVDGATRLQTVRHITWAQVMPMTAFLLVTGVISALQVFDLVFVMTAQNENEHTTVLNLWIYREFTAGQLGYAAAIGVLIFVLTLLATAFQLSVFREKKPRTPRRVRAGVVRRSVKP